MYFLESEVVRALEVILTVRKRLFSFSLSFAVLVLLALFTLLLGLSPAEHIWVSPTLGTAVELLKGALQLQLTAMVGFALLRYLSEFRLKVSSF